MERISVRIRAVTLTVALIAAPVVTLAQSQAPTREGNIWGWRDHQPSEAQVLEDENAAGIAPAKSDKDATASTVDQIYQELLHRSPG